VKTVLLELRRGQRFTGTHHLTFKMRREQADAVKVTFAYFRSRWAEDIHAVHDSCGTRRCASARPSRHTSSLASLS